MCTRSTTRLLLSPFAILTIVASIVAPAPSIVQAQGPESKGAEIDLHETPSVIGAGVVSTPAEEFRATMSPDDRTIVYVVTDHLFRHMTLVQATRSGDGWLPPEVVSFSGVWRDGDPSFAPDGRTLYFISNRPMPGDSLGVPRRDFNIWISSRGADGRWSDPVALDRSINTDQSEMSPSVTRSGTLYFTRGDSIMRAEKRAGRFSPQTVVSLPTKGAGDPSISADESFMVFDADGLVAGDVDLYVSCRSADGWMPPRRFADPVNSSSEEGDPAVSADGHTLYFFSRRLISVHDRAPRAQRASYAAIEREALENIYNGSRNLYSVGLQNLSCPG